MRPELFVAYSSSASVLIPFGIAFLKWRNMWCELKPLCLILILSLISDMLSIYLVKSSPNANTYLVVNFFMIGQFSLLVLIFRKQFRNSRIVDFILAVSLLFFVVNISFFQGPWVFNSVSNVVACLILIAFCLFYLYRLLNDLPIVHIQQLPMLWIAFAVLTYYGGNFFLFLVK